MQTRPVGRPKKMDGSFSSKKHYTKAEKAEHLERIKAMAALGGLDELECPEDLDEDSKKVFVQTVAIYKKANLKILNDLDVNALVMYSDAIADYNKFRKINSLYKATIDRAMKDTRTDPLKKIEIMDEAVHMMAEAENAKMKAFKIFKELNIQLGLSPVGRAQMKIKEDESKPKVAPGASFLFNRAKKDGTA